MRSFDFLDPGANPAARPPGFAPTTWPYYMDRGTNSAVVAACNGGSPASPILCGAMNANHGTDLNIYGIKTSDPGYGGHFNTFALPTNLTTPAPSPPAMLGNGSYSVVGVYRYDGVSPYRSVGIWSAGSETVLNERTGNLILDHGPYHFVTNFTFPNTSNWYFVTVTVQAQTGSCGANCVPTARVWVGGAVTPGVLTDVNSGVSGGSTSTPNVGAGAFLIGSNKAGSGQDSPVMSYAATMVYSRALTSPEVQMIYRSMKVKMAARGVTLQ